MRSRSIILLGALVLAAVACTSSGDATTTTAAATSTMSRATTTTVATTSTEAAEPAPLSLEDYLAALYRLDGQLSVDLVGAALNSAPDELLDAQVEIYTRQVEALRALIPPESAAEHHARSLAIMERAMEVTTAAREAIESSDPATTRAAGQALIDLSTEMTETGFELASLQRSLVEELLAGRTDPESEFVIALLNLQTSDTAETLQRLLGNAGGWAFGTVEELGALYQEIASFFEASLAEYQAIEPPDTWRDLYDRQIELLQDGIPLYQGIGDALLAGTEPDIEVLFQLLDFSRRGPELNADVNSRLADHLDGRPSLAVDGELPSMIEGDGDDTAIGEPMPALSGPDFDGELVAITNDGRPKAIVFLAHWCSHCQTEVPTVQAWLDETGGIDGVDLYSVATATDAGRANYPPSDWLADEGWTTPVVEDSAAGTAHRAFGAGGLPFWVFVNADGTVAQRVVGELPIDELQAILQGLG